MDHGILDGEVPDEKRPGAHAHRGRDCDPVRHILTDDAIGQYESSTSVHQGSETHRDLVGIGVAVAYDMDADQSEKTQQPMTR